MSEEAQGYRLSPSQRRCWLLQGGGPPLTARAVLRIEGRVDPEQVRSALAAAVTRHDILRTFFHRSPGMRLPLQVIAPAGELGWEHLCAGDAADLEWRLPPCILESGPRLHARLLDLGPAGHLLLLVLPSLCADGRSLDNLASELTAELAGQGPGDAELQYLQYAEWQNELSGDPDSAEGLAFWRNFGGRDRSLSLPGATTADAESRFAPAAIDLALPADLVAAISRAAVRCEAAPADLLLAIWQVLLWRLTGRRDTVVGRLADGRKFSELAAGVGPYARWLPTVCRCEQGLEFAHLVRQAARAAAEGEEWQEYLDGELSAEEDAFDAGFEWEEAWRPAMSANGPRLSFVSRRADLERYLVALVFAGVEGALRGALHYDPRRLSAASAERLVERLRVLLAAAVEDLAMPIGRLPLLPDAERRLLVDLAGAQREAPGATTVAELFGLQAERSAVERAVIYGGRSLSYGELEALANRLARRLRREGVGPEVVVAIGLERSVELMVAILAVLKAGGAYVPLDLSSPAERQTWLLKDSGARLVLTRQGLADRLPESARKLLLDAERESLLGEDGGGLAPLAGPDNLAYVLYTSGSTGLPKGVMVPHRGLVNYLNWAVETYVMGSGRGSVVHSPVGFDLTVTTLLGPLLAGREVVLVGEELGVEGLGSVLRQEGGFSVVKLTPSHLRLLSHWLPAERAASAAGCVVIGGEALTGEALGWLREHAPAVRLINEYGPTETVVGCTWYEVPRELSGSGAVPIGRPIANAQVYVLDNELEPAPFGVVGELYVGGAGVARGYLARPELTAERFVPDPFGPAGERLYRTGDLGRYLEGGELEYLGRVDEQVKVRGYRVELGEIEAALARCPGVRECAVALREDVAGDQRLVAYVVGEEHLEPGELRRILGEMLPDYMLPSAVLQLPVLPLTPNGKVDRRALPAPDAQRLEQRAPYASPETRIQTEIAEILGRLLRVERVGLDDSFFDLGGHSLLAVQVLAHLRTDLGVDLGLGDFFAAPTVRGLAERVETALVEASGDDALDGMLDLLEGMDDLEAERLLASGAGQEE